jgi:hypothetical protein
MCFVVIGVEAIVPEIHIQIVKYKLFSFVIGDNWYRDNACVALYVYVHMLYRN